MDNFAADIRSVEVNGTALAYADRGEGESVVFVHGTSQDGRTWNQQVGVVATHYRTIAYSRRYARPNEDIPHGQDDPMEPHVEDLLEMLRRLEAVPAHLVGSSWGGFICLLAAMKEPDLIQTMVLCEPPVLPLFISNSPGPGEIARLFLRGPMDAVRIVRFAVGVLEPTVKAYRAGNLEDGRRIFGSALLGKQGFESMPDDRKRMLDENQSAEVAQLLGAGFPPLRAADVRGISTRTLLGGGDRSPAVFHATLLGKLANLLPNAERVEIPEASHLMHEENPDAFNQALLSFLGHDQQGS